MWNKAKCILLASNNKKTSIYQIGNSNFIGYSQEDDRYTGRELYIINDDVIKLSDNTEGWFLRTHSSIDNIDVIQNPIFTSKYRYNKIIATTDKSLLLNYVGYEHGTGRKYESKVYLPQIPQSFIGQFITEYNQGKIISNVLVEYIDYCNKLICNNALCEHGCIETDIKLKVNPKDNTINIKTIKDSFNREEVEVLLFNLAEHYGMTSAKSEIDDFNIWISENL